MDQYDYPFIEYQLEMIKPLSEYFFYRGNFKRWFSSFDVYLRKYGLTEKDCRFLFDIVDFGNKGRENEVGTFSIVGKKTYMCTIKCLKYGIIRCFRYSTFDNCYMDFGFCYHDDTKKLIKFKNMKFLFNYYTNTSVTNVICDFWRKDDDIEVRIIH